MNPTITLRPAGTILISHEKYGHEIKPGKLADISWSCEPDSKWSITIILDSGYLATLMHDDKRTFLDNLNVLNDCMLREIKQDIAKVKLVSQNPMEVEYE